MLSIFYENINVLLIIPLSSFLSISCQFVLSIISIFLYFSYPPIYCLRGMSPLLISFMIIRLSFSPDAREEQVLCDKGKR